MNIQNQLRAQYVARWHTVSTTHRQTLAEHSFNVAIITRALLERQNKYNEEFINKATAIALTHDLGEVITGDIPTPTKKRLPESVVRNVLHEDHITSPLIRSAVKVADLIEANWFIRQHANSDHAQAVAGYVRSLLEEKLIDPDTPNPIVVEARRIMDDLESGEFDW